MREQYGLIRNAWYPRDQVIVTDTGEIVVSYYDLTQVNNLG